MEISIKPLGAGQEVGRSCIILKIKGVTIMLDCGVHMGYNDDRKFPDFRKLLKKSKNKTGINNYDNNSGNNNSSLFKNVEETKKDFEKVIDLLIISHFHLDHCGALPYFTELMGYKGPIICTQPTKAILPVTLEDFRKIMGEYRGEKGLLQPEQIIQCINKITTIEVNETRIINERIKVTCFYAGHVLGAAMFLVDVDGYRVAYTGDYNTISDRHLAGAYMPKLYPDVLMTETTYGDKVRDTKRVREREFLKKVQETIDKGGKVLIPIFALGRAQELCIVIDTYWRRTNCQVPIYFAGPMAIKANFYYKIFQNWMNSTVKNLFTKNNVFEFKYVKHGDKTMLKDNKPMVIFATPGMLHGGLSLSLFKEIAPDPKNCVIIPGYCSGGTVGNKILSGEKVIKIDDENIQVKCGVYYMSFSAHADAKGLLQLINNVQPRNVVLVHGDSEIMKTFKKTCEEKLNVRVSSPANGETITFTEDPFYSQINITENLFYFLRCLLKLEKNKIKKNHRTFVEPLFLRGNILDLDKISLSKIFNNNNLNLSKMVYKNKVKFKIKEEKSFDIFLEFLEKYFKDIYNHYLKLIQSKKLIIAQEKNKKKTGVESVQMNDNPIEEIENKIIFNYEYHTNKYDEKNDYFYILKILKIFDKFNKVI